MTSLATLWSGYRGLKIAEQRGPHLGCAGEEEDDLRGVHPQQPGHQRRSRPPAPLPAGALRVHLPERDPHLGGPAGLRPRPGLPRPLDRPGAAGAEPQGHLLHRRRCVVPHSRLACSAACRQYTHTLLGSLTRWQNLTSDACAVSVPEAMLPDHAPWQTHSRWMCLRTGAPS